MARRAARVVVKCRRSSRSNRPDGDGSRQCATRAMANTLEEWYASVPTVTRMYLTLTFAVTVGCALEVRRRKRSIGFDAERRRFDSRGEGGDARERRETDDARARLDAVDLAAERVLQQ
jgi:hypothetical protein